jgi:hypothetical protein
MSRLGILGLAATALVACVTTAPGAPSPSPIFGGQGAMVAMPREAPLLADSGTVSPPTGPCAAPSKPTDVALLDDFEDGDSHLFKGFERDGWWFAASDPTEGAKIYPPGDHFQPDRLPVAESSKDNLFAAHFKAEGQKDWGATWGVGLQWASKGIHCPLNASGFAGIRFRARGPGTVRVSFAMPETQPSDQGGSCKSGCYDFHAKRVYLSDRWTDYVVRWGALEQGGWGAEARFDPSRLLKLAFSVNAKDLPIDFWVDDIAFVDAHEAEALTVAERTEPAGTPSRSR